MNANQRALIAPFVVTFTLVILFARRILTPMISILTLAKGSLLVLMVSVATAVGSRVSQPVVTDWRRIGEPFLISTVALGGVTNVMPVMFGKVKQIGALLMLCLSLHMFSTERFQSVQLSRHKSDMKRFRNAVILALVACWVLNIMWCNAVLRIVPQFSSGPDSVSLQRAEEMGESSTGVLSRVIDLSYPQFGWVAVLVIVFILISITVSYVTVGNACKHTLDGFASDVHQKAIATPFQERGFAFPPRKLQLLVGMVLEKDLLFRGVLYIITFGFILAVSAINPHAFLLVLEHGASLALNLETGVFVVMMLRASRKMPSRYSSASLAPGSTLSVMEQNIPLPVNKYLYALQHVVLLYFSFAVVYDIILISLSLFK
mmetsp:Transcript_17637/g.28980  ORF Transcript_17637/g.28980 Transcript_17637/m.28980 type:complete len:375 (-) Transcript_17637:1498-2622(-)